MNGAPLPLHTGNREPSRREHLQALRNGADHLYRMLAYLRDDEGAKVLLLEIAQQLEGMRRTAVTAAHMPGARTPSGGIPGVPDPEPPRAA